MIVPMKKIAVIVQSKSTEPTIARLRSLGILHVEHQRVPKGKDIEGLQQDIALIDEAIGVLSETEFLGKRVVEEEGRPDDAKKLARHIIDSRKRLEQLREFSRRLKSQIAQWEPWGEFDPGRIRLLEKKGVFVKLYQIPVRDLKTLPAGLVVKRLFTTKGLAGCAVVSRERIDIPFKEIAPPKMNLKKMRDRMSEDDWMMKLVITEIKDLVARRAGLARVKESLENVLESHMARQGMGQSGSLSYITGYVPHDAVESLLAVSRKERWATSIKEVSEEDKVPTLIRNPRWVSIINPVFKIIEIIPGYRELDISMWFLLFFSVFFGMLIGDAGIGAVFFILTAIFHKKFGRRLRDRSIFVLFYILSTCAMIWGVLTCTFFGQEWLSGFTKPLIPAFRNDKNIQTLCFFIGAFHLSIAHVWRAIVKLPSLIALAEAGWILILWGAFLLARMLVLGDAFPSFGKWFFIAGAALVILFTKISKNVFKGLGAGLGNLLMNVVNSFTDVVSYIRLFAVGLATVAVADAFNKMALDIGYNSILTGLITSLILLLGHALNIMLGPMSVLVHGVRLNVLEFCSHLDITWSGLAYRPLKEETS